MLLTLSMGLLVFWLEIKVYQRTKLKSILLYAAIGLIWALFYVIMLFAPNIDHELARIACVRPLITITLAVIASGAIFRYRSQQ
jgi:uncharacterized membrane protein